MIKEMIQLEKWKRQLNNQNKMKNKEIIQMIETNKGHKISQNHQDKI